MLLTYVAWLRRVAARGRRLGSAAARARWRAPQGLIGPVAAEAEWAATRAWRISVPLAAVCSPGDALRRRCVPGRVGPVPSSSSSRRGPAAGCGAPDSVLVDLADHPIGDDAFVKNQEASRRRPIRAGGRRDDLGCWSVPTDGASAATASP